MTWTSMAVSERERLAALERYQVHDLQEQAFDELVTLAALICGTPVAIISVVEHARAWAKARIGAGALSVPRQLSFCTHAIEQTDVLIVGDAREDARFAANPFVVGDPHIRFYAGAPLVTEGGHRLGALCVLDARPRELAEYQVNSLRMLARQAMSQLELRRHIAESRDLERLEREQAAQMRKIFASNLIHELRTPLTSIRGSLGLLASGCGGMLPDEAREMVAVAERNSARLVAVINDMFHEDPDERDSH